MKIKAIVHDAEEGGYWAEVPALPGCFTEADSLPELKANLSEAIEGWLEAAAARNPAGQDSSSRELELAV